MVKKILKSMNTDFNIQFLPWARGYEMTQKGNYFFTFPYIKTSRNFMQTEEYKNMLKQVE